MHGRVCPGAETSALQSSKLQTQHFLARLKNSSFVRNVLIVMSGTAAAQMIGLALTPIISRLFSPSDFGMFGAFNSVSGIIAAGVTLEYSQAIMLPKHKEEAINLFCVSCLCTVAISLLCLAVCFTAPSLIMEILKTGGTWMLSLLVLSTMVTGLNSSCQAWCVRVKAFKHTSASQVIHSISSNGTQVGLGYLRAGAAGLIVSPIIADILASLNLIRVLIPDLIATRERIRWSQMRQLAYDYRDFPIYSASQGVINALSAGLPVLLLTHFYGIAVAGAYAFGMRILTVPMGFILRALRQVLFQKAGEIQHQSQSLAPLYVRTTTGLFGLAVFPSLVLFLWAPQLFTWIFGLQWHTAGEFAQSLILWTMFIFCNLPAVLFARLIRIQRTVFFYNLVLLAARTLALILGGLYLSAWQTITLFSLLGAFMNAVLILLVGHAIIKNEGDVNWSRIRDCLTAE